MDGTRRQYVYAALSLVAGLVSWILLDSWVLGLGWAALGVFLIATAGSFQDSPMKAVRSDGEKISPQEIKHYREANPDASIAQAIEAIKREG